MMRVFVYGTLRRGEPNAYLISDASRGVAKFIGFGTTVQKFPLIVYGRFNTPFLLDEAGTGKHIRGDIYDVDGPMASILDTLEGHPHYYLRQPIDVELENTKETSSCHAYFLTDYKAELLHEEFFTEYSSAEMKARDLEYVAPSDRPSDTGRKHWADVKKHAKLPDSELPHKSLNG